MKLDVRNIVFAPEGESQNFSVDFKEKIDEEILAESIVGEVNITNLPDMLLCSFDLKAKIKLTCDRCLSEFFINKKFKFKQEYYIEPSEDDDYFVSKDNEIEISEPIIQEIISSISVKKLCKTDCKGICSSCGEDLNVKKCKCSVIRN